MMTIPQAFEEFRKALRLKRAERDEASRQHTHLREALAARMKVDTTLISGSYGRKTSIRPLNDIDVFLVLRPTNDLHDKTKPSKVLTAVKDALETEYKGKTAKLQARSVNIEFSGTGIAYDVVPAFAADGDIYRIPDRDADDWIRTNPKIHASRSTEANEQAGKRLKPLLKTIKHANVTHAVDENKPARSFHVEVLSWSILTAPPENDLQGLITLLTGLEQRLCDPCPDPAGLGPEIQPSSDRCKKAKEWAGRMGTLAKEADGLAKDGRTSEAHAKLYELFGDPWPEKGTRPSTRPSPVAITGIRGPDHSGSRFG